MCMHCGSPYPRARKWAKGSAIQVVLYPLVIFAIIIVAVNSSIDDSTSNSVCVMKGGSSNAGTEIAQGCRAIEVTSLNGYGGTSRFPCMFTRNTYCDNRQVSTCCEYVGLNKGSDGAVCSHGDQCSSKVCRGCPNGDCTGVNGDGYCCGSKGSSTGCRACDSNGDCSKCANGYIKISGLAAHLELSDEGRCKKSIGAVCSSNSQCANGVTLLHQPFP